MQTTIWTTPNILTLSRLPLSAGIFSCIDCNYWWMALSLFAVASVTDWLDGWWARKFNQLSAFGRMADPLIDKVMILGGFVFLLEKPGTGLITWVVCTILAREILITGLRGHMEALGVKFGADWFGKLKMVLQCVLFAFMLFFQAFRRDIGTLDSGYDRMLEIVQLSLIYITLAATVGSGIQYTIRAWPHLKR